MASYKAFVISAFLLVNIILVIQSAPIEKIFKYKQIAKQHPLKSVDSDKSSTTSTSPTTTVSQNSFLTPKIIQEKKKRYIDDDQLDGLFGDDDEVDVDQLPSVKSVDKPKHILHAKIQETSAKIHDNADKPVDSDDSKVFSDIKMTPKELINIVRQRRHVKLNDKLNQRRKRALSPYDFYDTDSFYDPYADLIERQQYVRPIRSFAPIYWYPSAYERNVRSALEPSFHESSEWPTLYSNTIDDEEEAELPASMFGSDDDDENDYESNRYPILLSSSNNPFDNFELQQQYNTDDLPIDEEFVESLGNDDDDDDDDDEDPYRLFYEKQRPYDARYEPHGDIFLNERESVIMNV